MSLPTAVTQRAEGTGYVGVTGMEFAVQTGFAIRTGFYLTNSGTSNVIMQLQLVGNDFEAYDFISGVYSPQDSQDERVTILAGSTKFIPFDFYGYKDVSGPQSPISGPAGTGSYNTQINLSFRSELDGSLDQTYYAGQPALGVIRVNLTGYVTGHFGSTTELTPAYPKKFLGITGQKDAQGTYYHDLKWTNPPTGYYFEKYKIEQSTDATATWSTLANIDITKINKPHSLPASVGGTFLSAFYYGTPTGIDGFNTYTHSNLSPNTDYYYRIRGEHYDSAVTSSLISYSDWVYCSGVDTFESPTSDDVANGLISGSSSLQPGDNPDPKIKLSTAEKGAMTIYFRNGQKNANLSTMFNNELSQRGIAVDDFSTYFTGVHYILNDDFVVAGSPNYGVTDTLSPAMDVPLITSAGTEVGVNLYLGKNSKIIGQGGAGGTAGFCYIKFSFAQNYGGQNIFAINDYEKSSNGQNGGAALQIGAGVSKFKIFMDPTSAIYGGGGGGGGGDLLFAAKAATRIRSAIETYEADYGVQLSAEGVYFEKATYTNTKQDFVYVKHDDKTKTSTNVLTSFDISDLQGYHYGGYGGGGQSWTTSYGGLISQEGNIRITNSRSQSVGSFASAGAGAGYSLINKMSQGGDGGDFGQFGEDAPETDYLDGFTSIGSITNNINSRDIFGDLKARSAGRGGFAINCLSTSYTQANMMGKLIAYAYNYDPTSLNGFVAMWDANASDTGASDGGLVSTWTASAKNANIASATITAGSTAPTFHSSGDRISFFNNHGTVEFKGNAVATINGVQGTNSYELTESSTEFEFFYSVLPTSFSSTPIDNQFDLNEGVYKIQGRNAGLGFLFTKFSANGKGTSFYQNTSSGSSIIETSGLGDVASPNGNFVQADYVNNVRNRQMTASAIVYNVTGKKTNDGNNLTVKVYINNIEKGSSTVAGDSFQFDAAPKLGKFEDGNSKTSFNVANIILYNRQLLPEERKNVFNYLSGLSKKGPVTTAVSDYSLITRQTPSNKVSDGVGFAGILNFKS